MIRLLLLFLVFSTAYAACGDGTANYPAPDGNGHVTIPEGVTSIPTSQYEDCTALTSITLPSTLETINTYAFKNSAIAGDLVIPEGVTTIHSFAFYGLGSLTSITIPESVTSFGSSNFGLASSQVSLGYSAINIYFNAVVPTSSWGLPGIFSRRLQAHFHFPDCPTCPTCPTGRTERCIKDQYVSE